MTTSPETGIVTVLYNSAPVLPGFFASLAGQTFRDFVLYIIDNASPDNSLALARDLARGADFKVVVIPLEVNAGAAGGNNAGIRRAMADGCRMVLLTNNDVEFAPGTIETLRSGMITIGADMAAPKIYFYGTDIIWFAGGRFLANGWNSHTGRLKEDKGQWDTPGPTGFAPTTFLLLRREVFEKTGLIDETYFIYWEDTDLIYRALHKKKFALWYIPTAVVHHKESTTTVAGSDLQNYYLYRNFIYFALKNYGFPKKIYVPMLALLSDVKMVLQSNVKGAAFRFRAHVDGVKLYCGHEVKTRYAHP